VAGGGSGHARSDGVVGTSGHPEVAVGVQEVRLAEAVRLVGRGRQHGKAEPAGGRLRLVGIAAMEAELGPDAAVAAAREERVVVVGDPHLKFSIRD
jgi:hypothetical protein